MTDNTSYHSAIVAKTLASNAKAIVMAHRWRKMGLMQLTKLQIVQYELDDTAQACNHVAVELPL